MNGLECSEIMLSNLERTTRIDAEFYAKNNLRVLDILSKYSLDKITDNYYVSDGNHMSVSDSFVDVGVPYYRGQDIYNVFIEDSSPICIDKKTYTLSTMMRSWLKKGDVLLSIVGAIIGNTAIVSSYKEATCSCKLAILRAKTKNDNYYYLHSFIKSKYGQNQIQKFRRGAAQTGLLLEDMDQIFIPNLGDKLKKYISDIYVNVYRLINSAKKCYSDAEQILLKSLNMDNFVPSQKNTTTKLLSQFMNAGRLDAEYFQPKYDDIENKIELLLNDKKNGCFTVNNIISESNRVIKIEDKKEYKYIELSDIDNYGNVTDCTIDIGINLPSRARKEVYTGDVIVSSLEGSLQKCAIITETFNGALVSTGFHVVKSDEINSETLLLLFKSWFMQELMRKHSTGAIMAATSDDSFKKILLPVVKLDVQEMIANKIQKSFELRAKSNELLEAAKRAVEIAIEEDEETAMQYLAQFECVGKEV